MYPSTFEYHRAESVEEALELLAAHPGAKLLAGGHSLIPMMKLRLAQPPALVDVGRIEALRGITAEDSGLRIGALTTHAELAASSPLREACLLLAEAAAEIGDPAVRNRGTIGGNIAHADPASDLPAVLVAVDASVEVVGRGGASSIPARRFFIGLLDTALTDGEVVTAIRVPRLAAGTGSAYLKVEHPASGYALCGAAALLRLDGGRVAEAVLAFNGVSATPHLAEEVTSDLVGGGAEDEALRAALEGLSIPDPLGDVHASAEYRVELARVYGRRALAAARDRAAQS